MTINWKEDLPIFKEKTDAFFAGNLPLKDYKGFFWLLWKLWPKGW